MKLCTRCKLVKPDTDFSRRLSRLRSICRTCASQYFKQYRENNKARLQVRGRRWKLQHKEEAAEYNRQWQAAHPDYFDEYNRLHAVEHRAYSARRRRERPDLLRVYDRRRRAKKLAVAERFTAQMEQAVKTHWHNACALCSATKRLEIDHWYPLSKGFPLTMSNAVLLCGQCNRKKRDKLPTELKDQTRAAYVEQQLVVQQQVWSFTTLTEQELEIAV